MLEAAGYPDKEGALLYGFFADGEDVPFYIGSTRHSIRKRAAHHIALVQSNTHSNRHFLNKMRKLGIENVTCIELARICFSDQFNAERVLIKWSLGRGVKLTNKIHNGIDFDVCERAYEYQNADLTADQIDYLLSPAFSDGLKAGGFAAVLGSEIISVVKRMVSDYPDQTRDEYPRLFEVGSRYV